MSIGTRTQWAWILAGAASLASAQSVDLSTLRQMAETSSSQPLASNPLPGPADALPVSKAASEETPNRLSQAQRLEDEIKAMKAAEPGPPRFASDLFDHRESAGFQTDGGISEDYVLGTGDRVNLNVVGSANFAVPLEVDGRGVLVIPKIGSARVGGLSLGKAREAVQSLVARNFSRAQADLQVTHLREVRISVLGDVYKPGSYLVPSLGSLVNVLSLSGGPTPVGSYRDIRVVRGGQVVFHLDLYPLRAEGLGNPNFALQSGDVVFVPLAKDTVTVEGAFLRVVNQPVKPDEAPYLMPAAPGDGQRDALVRDYLATLAQLGLPSGATPATAAPVSGSAPASAPSTSPRGAGPLPGAALDPAVRQTLEARLAYLRDQILDLDAQKRVDHRLTLDPVTKQPLARREDNGEPEWQQRWEQSGQAPVMGFEVKPGETLADLVGFAGGLVPEAGTGPIAVRTRSSDGRLEVVSVQGEALEEARTPLHRGDVVSVPLARTTSDRMVQIAGWGRAPGTFARTEGLRVGDLLKQTRQVLPDTYLHRGEIVRTLPDGTSRFFSFDVAKALAGLPDDNLPLADRDRIELYRNDDLRLQKTVTLLGPAARPGVYAFHEGMRASDLIFRAGVPQKNADRFDAELAHAGDGKPSEVRRLDLAKLLASDQSGPAAPRDESDDPLLRPDDQLSLFEKPGFRIHRTVLIQGQVAHPGSYALDRDHETLSEVIQRAGGLTPEAMPGAGIFLRQIGRTQPGAAPELDAGPGASVGVDPASGGINAVLARLNETKRNPVSGQLLASPLLHGLAGGDLSRLVVDFGKALKGDPKADVELLDGDAVIIPRQTEVAYVVGETASPFAAYKVEKGETVRELLAMAGGPTRNADTWNIRLLKADGRIVDAWVMRKNVEPGDTLLVPQRIRRDSTWQENLTALTPLAIFLNTLK